MATESKGERQQMKKRLCNTTDSQGGMKGRKSVHIYNIKKMEEEVVPVLDSDVVSEGWPLGLPTRAPSPKKKYSLTPQSSPLAKKRLLLSKSSQPTTTTCSCTSYDYKLVSE